jgi:tetratricopeptide (TPR) repeat protein
MHELHHRAGWPSVREMASEVGCSHTTVWAAFCQPRVPRWGLLELIVEALGGDVATFHDLWLAATGQATSPIPPRPPRELPADVVAFTGRGEHMAALDALLARAGPALAVATISGTAGVGKTALALHWAHRVAARFPDGQLYVNLRGYEPSQPVHAAEALEALLRALGERSSGIPYGLADRAARYRTLVADRRMLIVLDNVYSVEQVRELLPGSPTCFVVVTSRDTLPALVARHGATRVDLDLLPAGEAHALLGTLIGARVAAQPQPAAQLVQLCARLPLALRLAAELAAARPRAGLADLVDELADESRRLDLLAAGDDDYTAVRAVFSWSLRQLQPSAARAFTLLGLHPGADIDADALAALTGTDRAEARRISDALVRANLLSDVVADRFSMHDLLHAYAAEQAARLAPDERRAALARLRKCYLVAARAATAAARRTSGPDSAPASEPAEPVAFPSAEAGLAWLDAERANLLAVAGTGTPSDDGYAVALSATLAGYLDAHSHYHEALTLHELACAAATAAGDQLATGRAWERLGTVRRRLGGYHAAIECYQRALAVQHECGDRSGAAVTRHGLGIACLRLGRTAEAVGHVRVALDTYRDTGDEAGTGAALYALSLAESISGRYPAAREYGQQALAVLREVGDRTGEGRTLNNLGLLAQRQGDSAGACDYFSQALRIARDVGNRTGEAVALANLGDLDLATGAIASGRERFTAALSLSRNLGYRVGQADALRGLGVAAGRSGRVEEALANLSDALAICAELGEHDTRVHVLLDLGDLLRDSGQRSAAAQRYREALELAEVAGDPYTRGQATERIEALQGSVTTQSTQDIAD